MVSPPSAKRYAWPDASSLLCSAQFPSAVKIVFLTITLLCLFIPPSAMAADDDIFAASPHASAGSITGKTEIITDEEHNTVRIMIDGKEVMTVDKDGLHVSGNIDYTGTIADKTEASDAP